MIFNSKSRYAEMQTIAQSNNKVCFLHAPYYTAIDYFCIDGVRPVQQITT